MHRTITVAAIALTLVAGVFAGRELPGVEAQETAVADASPPAGSVVDVPVDVHDMALSPVQTVFRVGQTYRFDVTNSGKATHEMVLEAAGAVDQALQADGRTAEAADIAPGATKQLVWTFSKPGAFQIACHQPGHYQAGMVRQIQVTDKATVVPVSVGDMFVTVPTGDLKANTLYTFLITNTGKATHEVVAEQAGTVDKALEGANEPEEAAESEDVQPGTVRELPWFFTTPGQYQLACHKPGHYEAGMVKTFTVR